MHPTGVPVRWVCRVWVGSRYHSKVDSKMAVRAFLSIHGEPMIEIFGDLPVAIDRVEPLVGEHPVVSEDREG